MDGANTEDDRPRTAQAAPAATPVAASDGTSQDIKIDRTFSKCIFALISQRLIVNQRRAPLGTQTLSRLESDGRPQSERQPRSGPSYFTTQRMKRYDLLAQLTANRTNAIHPPIRAFVLLLIRGNCVYRREGAKIRKMLRAGRTGPKGI
jgi:hypothetical protein